MKRSLWYILLGAAIGLTPSLSQAAAFQALEVSALTLSSSLAGVAVGGGIVELGQQEGLIITDIQAMVYSDTTGGVVTTLTGYSALLQAVKDGQSSTSTQGIACADARNPADPEANHYAIAMVDYTANPQNLQSTFGGYNLATLAASSTGDLYILRETYPGDTNLAGGVSLGEYQSWLLGYGNNRHGWNNGDFNYSGTVTLGDYQTWLVNYGNNYPSLGTDAGPVQFNPSTAPAGVSAVPEPGTLGLLFFGSLGSFAYMFMRRKLWKGNCSMRNSVALVALVCLLGVAGTAKASLLTYTVEVDNVAGKETNGTTINASATGVSGLGTPYLTLPSNTASATVTMVIVATVSNPSGTSNNISLDGFSSGYLNIQAAGVGGTTAGTGTGTKLNTPVQGAFVNSNAGTGATYGAALTGPNDSYTYNTSESSVNTQTNPQGTQYTGKNATATPGASNILKHNYASPVQAFYDQAGIIPTNHNPSGLGPDTYAGIYEWSTAMNGGQGASPGTVTGGSLVGLGSAYTTSNFNGSGAFSGVQPFVASYSMPDVPGFSSNGAATANAAYLVTRGTNGSTTVQNGTNATSAVIPLNDTFLLGASGISASSASFILGTVTYTVSGAVSGGTTSVTASPADFTQVASAENLSFSSYWMVNGVHYTSLSTSATNASSGAVTLGGVTDVPASISITPASLTYWAGQLLFANGPTLNPSGALLSAGTTQVAGANTGGLGSIFGGQTTTITGSVANTLWAGNGNSAQDPLSWWTVAASGNVGGTLSNATSGGNPAVLAASATTGYSFTYTANANFFGPDTITLTPTGSGTNVAGALNATSSPQTVSINVIGAANRGNGASGSAAYDGFGTPGTETGNLLSSASIPNGGSLVGLETTLSGTNSHGIGATYALILAGTNNSGGPITLTEQWRSRANSELPAVAAANHSYGLVSDVVAINGITGGTASVFALQMSYDPSQFSGGTAGAAAAASGGFLFLGYRDNAGVWVNAAALDGTLDHAGNTVTNGNFNGTGEGVDAVANFQGSWSAFTSQDMSPTGAHNYTLQQVLGSWGVDTVNDVAWAVVDHDAEFAVVPEPSTLALLGAGLAALALAYRRRKAAKP